MCWSNFCLYKGERMEEIELLDPVSNTSYALSLSSEDVERAKIDEVFANSLLRHAIILDKANRKTNENSACSSAVTVQVHDGDSELGLRTPQDNISDSMDEGPKGWSYETTLQLIVAVESLHENLNHPKKRKTVWLDIANILQAEDIEVTANACHRKWMNLLRTYKKVKDTKNKTGRGSVRFSFFEKLDQFLGVQPNYSSPHSVDVSQIGECSNEWTNNQNVGEQMAENELHLDKENDAPRQTEKRARKSVTTEYFRAKQRFIETKEEILREKWLWQRQEWEKKRELLELKNKLEERKVNALEELVKSSRLNL